MEAHDGAAYDVIKTAPGATTASSNENVRSGKTGGLASFGFSPDVPDGLRNRSEAEG